MLNRVFVFLLASIMVFLALSAVFESSLVRLRSYGSTVASDLTWLHVDGRYIKNEFNETVYLRGATFGGMGESGLPYWNGGLDKLVQMMAAYISLSGHESDSNKANVIRVGTGNINGSGWDPSVMDAAVDDIVSLAKANGIYVVVEYHGGLDQNASTALANDPSPWINWFLHWVNRYINEPTVVGFEIFNEPYAPLFGNGNSTLGQELWVNMVKQMVGNITAVNPKALIFVSSAFPGYNEVGNYWIRNPLVGNVVYTWDWYYKDFPGNVKAAYAAGLYDEGKILMDQAIYMASGRAVFEGNLPVLNSEFGFSPGEYASIREMSDFLEALNKYDNSWYEFWWWSNSNQQGLVTDDYGRLSEQGVAWADYLWSGNPGYFPFVNPFATPTPVPTLSEPPASASPSSLLPSPIPVLTPTPTPTPAPTHFPIVSPSKTPAVSNSASPVPTNTPGIVVSPSPKPSSSPTMLPTSSPYLGERSSSWFAFAFAAFAVPAILGFVFVVWKSNRLLFFAKFKFRARAFVRKIIARLCSLLF